MIIAMFRSNDVKELRKALDPDARIVEKVFVKKPVVRYDTITQTVTKEVVKVETRDKKVFVEQTFQTKLIRFERVYSNEYVANVFITFECSKHAFVYLDYNDTGLHLSVRPGRNTIKIQELNPVPQTLFRLGDSRYALPPKPDEEEKAKGLPHRTFVVKGELIN